MNPMVASGVCCNTIGDDKTGDSKLKLSTGSEAMINLATVGVIPKKP